MYCKAKQPPGGGAVTDSHKRRCLPYPPTPHQTPFAVGKWNNWKLLYYRTRTNKTWEMSLDQAMLVSKPIPGVHWGPFPRLPTVISKRQEADASSAPLEEGLMFFSGILRIRLVCLKLRTWRHDVPGWNLKGPDGLQDLWDPTPGVTSFHRVLSHETV